MTTLRHMLTVLAVDDEPPALDELAFLLRRDPHVAEVRTADDGAAALRELDGGDIDVIVLDIKMPGLTGLDLARVLTRFRKAPAVVFVTAYDEHAVEAFDIGAADYVMKPFRPDRLAEAVRRAHTSLQAGAGEVEDETIVVELAGVTRYVRRSDVLHVTAHGDYARLHTADGEHLVRMPLSTLAERWADAGFVRIHRSHLVALDQVRELRGQSGRLQAVVAGRRLPVARRHARELRELLAGRGGEHR